MKKSLLLLLPIILIFNGCFLTKWANKGDEVVNTVDVKVEEIKEVYVDLKETYTSKVHLYKLLRDTIYGKNGETDIWKHISDREPYLKSQLTELDITLVTMHTYLVDMDSKLTGRYIKWQEYKEVAKKVTDQMRKIDLVMEGLNFVIKSKMK